MTYTDTLKNIILSKLLNLEIIKFGNFTLKNGTTSTIYMDFRRLINYPNLYTYIDKLFQLNHPEIINDLKDLKWKTILKK